MLKNEFLLRVHFPVKVVLKFGCLKCSEQTLMLFNFPCWTTSGASLSLFGCTAVWVSRLLLLWAKFPLTTEIHLGCSHLYTIFFFNAFVRFTMRPVLSRPTSKMWSQSVEITPLRQSFPVCFLLWFNFKSRVTQVKSVKQSALCLAAPFSFARAEKVATIWLTVEGIS